MILENVSQEIELRDNYLVGLTNLGAKTSLKLLTQQIANSTVLSGSYSAYESD